jgi:DNA-binding NarL/FixJ family response regulator
MAFLRETAIMINVLIAESSQVASDDMQHAIERAVEAAGEECLVAHCQDGVTAFRKAKRLQPHLAVVSARLPLGGGAQVVHALRHYSPSTRMIVFGLRRECDFREFADAGAHTVFTAALDDSNLEAAVRSVLGLERLQRSDA